MGLDENHSIPAKNRISRTILFVPSNPSHVAAQLPVAEELERRGHRSVFLSRDSFVNQEYKIESILNSKGLAVLRFESDYQPDFGRLFPESTSYLKFKAELTHQLSAVGADAVVVCNDDAALFDRMVVHLFRRANKQAFLIQESVRPANRRLAFKLKLKEQGKKEILHDLFQDIAFRLRLGPFFRKGYAHSDYSRIFAAGDMYCQRLLKEGIDKSRIMVTGQPRLDGNVLPHAAIKEDNNGKTDRVLLFCNQPVKCSVKTQERLFVDLVDVVNGLAGVKLLVKLHPRDYPESHWLKLLQPGQGKSLMEVTRTRPLASCFEVADAFMTIASTTCLEAMDYGLPVGLIDYLPIEWYLPYSHNGAVISVQSRDKLRSSVEILLFDESVRKSLRKEAEQVLQNELYLRDGKSAWRIANCIEKSVS